MIHIGIDVGLSGAMASIDHTGHARVADLETVETEAGKRLDGRALILMLRAFVPADSVCTVIVEDIRPRPMGNGGRAGNTMHSQGSLMRSRGIVEAVCDIARVPVVWVQPQTWKRHYGLLGKDKDAGRLCALSLFPRLQDDLRRKKDHNRGDSLLLARYLMSHGPKD